MANEDTTLISSEYNKIIDAVKKKIKNFRNELLFILENNKSFQKEGFGGLTEQRVKDYDIDEVATHTLTNLLNVWIAEFAVSDKRKMQLYTKVSKDGKLMYFRDGKVISKIRYEKLRAKMDSVASLPYEITAKNGRKMYFHNGKRIQKQKYLSLI